MMGASLSEYHTGYRAFSRELLTALPLERNSDDFVFDNQMLAQAILYGARIGEISCPTLYFPEASSINLRRSTIYGFGVLRTALQFRLAKWGLHRSEIFEFDARSRRSVHGSIAVGVFGHRPPMTQPGRTRQARTWPARTQIDLLLFLLLAVFIARVWLMQLPSQPVGG